MKVLFTCDSMKCGGSERVISLLSNEFSNNGIEVFIRVISTEDFSSFYSLSKKINIRSIFIGNKPNIFRRLILLRKTIKDIEPDVVISFLPHVIAYTYFSLLFTRFKFIVSERNDPNSYKTIYKILNKFIFRKADGCIFQTTEAMEWYRKKGSNNRVILNPVSTDERLICKEGPYSKTIISAGRMVSQKNFKLLVDAFSLLGKEQSDYKLMIFGEGPLKENLQDYINQLNLSSRIILLGNNIHWHAECAKSSLFVLSSDFEGFPNALAEALSLGVPCVATDCPIGGPKELSRIYDNILLCKKGDALDMVEAIKKQLAFERKRSYLPLLSSETIGKEWISYLKGVIDNAND